MADCWVIGLRRVIDLARARTFGNALRRLQDMMHRIFTLSLLLGWAGSLAAETKFDATDWPNWRGLTSDGQAKFVKGLPTEWSEIKNVVWKLSLIHI